MQMWMVRVGDGDGISGDGQLFVSRYDQYRGLGVGGLDDPGFTGPSDV